MQVRRKNARAHVRVEHAPPHLFCLAHGLEVVAEEPEGHLHEVADGAEVGVSLHQHHLRLLGDPLVRLHVEASGAASHAGEHGLGGGDALQL